MSLRHYTNLTTVRAWSRTDITFDHGPVSFLHDHGSKFSAFASRRLISTGACTLCENSLERFSEFCVKDAVDDRIEGRVAVAEPSEYLLHSKLCFSVLFFSFFALFFFLWSHYNSGEPFKNALNIYNYITNSSNKRYVIAICNLYIIIIIQRFNEKCNGGKSKNSFFHERQGFKLSSSTALHAYIPFEIIDYVGKKETFILETLGLICRSCNTKWRYLRRKRVPNILRKRP